MTPRAQGVAFLKSLCDSHEGNARIEIDTGQSEVRFKDGKPTFLHLMIELSLGVPVDLVFRGFPIRNDTLYRPEGRGDFTYDACHHGRLSWLGACGFVLPRALDKAKPGASSLLDFDLPAITANRIRRVLTGVSGEPLLFQVKLPQNWS